MTLSHFPPTSSSSSNFFFPPLAYDGEETTSLTEAPLEPAYLMPPPNSKNESLNLGDLDNTRDFAELFSDSLKQYIKTLPSAIQHSPTDDATVFPSFMDSKAKDMYLKENHNAVTSIPEPSLLPAASNSLKDKVVVPFNSHSSISFAPAPFRTYTTVRQDFIPNFTDAKTMDVNVPSEPDPTASELEAKVNSKKRKLTNLTSRGHSTVIPETKRRKTQEPKIEEIIIFDSKPKPLFSPSSSNSLNKNETVPAYDPFTSHFFYFPDDPFATKVTVRKEATPDFSQFKPIPNSARHNPIPTAGPRQEEAYKKWTPPEIAKLFALRQKGFTFAEIAMQIPEKTMDQCRSKHAYEENKRKKR